VVRDVDLERKRLAARVVDALRELHQAVVPPGDQCDLGAFAGERQRSGLPDSGGGSRHNRDPAVELAHIRAYPTGSRTKTGISRSVRSG
jgi:hypothetical protein